MFYKFRRLTWGQASEFMKYALYMFNIPVHQLNDYAFSYR